ncbi:hypothetical protein [Chitinophaga pinensis]|nr:hypothetical protein [Chitinophaga pinensis]
MAIKLNGWMEIIEQAKARGKFSYMDSEEDDEIRMPSMLMQLK